MRIGSAQGQSQPAELFGGRTVFLRSLTWVLLGFPRSGPGGLVGGGALWHKWPVKRGAAVRNQSGKQLRGGELGSRQGAAVTCPVLLPPDVALRVAGGTRWSVAQSLPPACHWVGTTVGLSPKNGCGR